MFKNIVSCECICSAPQFSYVSREKKQFRKEKKNQRSAFGINQKVHGIAYVVFFCLFVFSPVSVTSLSSIG